MFFKNAIGYRKTLDFSLFLCIIYVTYRGMLTVLTYKIGDEMINRNNLELGQQRSAIRELFEYGKKRKAEIGEENVHDFSLGNPSLPCPSVVSEEIARLVEETEPVALHGYTSAQGDLSVRRAIAEYITDSLGYPARAENIYLTVGCAAALVCSLSAVVCPGEEVILLSPYFPEYKVFARGVGAEIKEVPCKGGNFGLDVDAIKNALTERTAAIVINSPNNPTGAVYTEEEIAALANMLSTFKKESGRTVYIISDEPYRELVYDGVQTVFIPKYYKDTIVCYSFSKSLSLPGERIGYVFVPSAAEDSALIYDAVAGSGRLHGYVCAPSLLQYVLPACLGKTADISIYDRNRQLLYDWLSAMGYTATRPSGAFYLFLKSPENDANAFCERAKKYELLLVPSDSFGYPGYVRISYCVKTEQIEKALPAFAALAKEYGLEG